MAFLASAQVCCAREWQHATRETLLTSSLRTAVFCLQVQRRNRTTTSTFCEASHRYCVSFHVWPSRDRVLADRSSHSMYPTFTKWSKCLRQIMVCWSRRRQHHPPRRIAPLLWVQLVSQMRQSQSATHLQHLERLKVVRRPCLLDAGHRYKRRWTSSALRKPRVIP
jgi:hypothetical protein